MAFFLCIIVTFASCTDKKSEQQEKPEAPAAHNGELKSTDELAKSMIERFEKVLDLSEEQKEKITAMIKSVDSTSLNTNANARKEIRENIINDVLTPEQQKQLKERMGSKKNEGSH